MVGRRWLEAFLERCQHRAVLWLGSAQVSEQQRRILRVGLGHGVQ